nr:double-strand break repair protein AddB [Sphingomonas solaris]
MAERLSLYSIPPHRAFADALAAGLIARAGDDPLALARGTILLPNARAITALRDAFVRRAGDGGRGGLLLPRMAAIGDPDLDERLGTLLDPIGEEAEVPPAIDPLDRTLILARLVGDSRRLGGDPIGAAEAVRLATDLGRTLDQLTTEGIDPRRLTRVVDPTIEPMLSTHWQASLAVLETILTHWPVELERRGRIDLAERRNRLLDRAARRWRQAPPPGFVVAAGIAVSAPAATGLLRTIAGLPQGLVVFAGLDLAMPDDEWDALDPPAPADGGRKPRAIETHPQYLLKRMLDGIGAARGEVRQWRWRGGHDSPAARGRAIGHAMTPAAFTARWSDLSRPQRRLSGVRVATFAGPAEEAQAIAIAMRQALETPERTVALVTPDRALARRVVAHLGRWGIAADDSAGRPLSATSAGALLIALAEAAAEGFAPVPLLAVLKHPLVNGGGVPGEGDARLAWLDGARRLDLALRGPRPPAGLAGVSAFLAEGDDRARRLRGAAAGWWRETRALLDPLETAFAGDTTMPALLAALREAAGRLAGDAIWSGPAGRAAAELLSELERAAADGPASVRADDIPVILRQMADAVAIRPPLGGHPRAFIWGVIEARLQQADLTILGGLSEGVWPALPAPDPWLAPRIRADLGLPGLEQRIGVMAHDFAHGLGAPEVLVTRSRRGAGGPAIASRFWLRLEAMTGGLPLAPRLGGWARALDHPTGPIAPADRPAPSPPVADRPKAIAVTNLDRLKADPFAFYASAMLRLSRLDAVDADPSPAWRGSAVHAVFEAWMAEDACDPTKLAARARTMLADIAAHPVLKALWTPRLMEAIDFTAARVAEQLAEGRRPLVAEIFGEAIVDGIRLYGKVDRIDRLADGGLAIIDYKTGKPPGAAQVAAGYAMQLGLLGLIAENGGFIDPAGQPYAGTPRAFEYWSMAAAKGQLGFVSSPAGIRRGEGIAEEDFVGHAARILQEAIARWLTGDAPFTAKLHPEHAPYGDYDQLMRLDEWYGRDG